MNFKLNFFHPRNMSLRYKLFFLYSLVFTIVMLAESIGIYFFVRQNLQNNLESELKNSTSALRSMVEVTANASIRNSLRATAENNRQIVESFYRQFRAQTSTETEAKKRAASALLSQTIGKTGYIYCLMQMHLKKHQLIPQLPGPSWKILEKNRLRTLLF